MSGFRERFKKAVDLQPEKYKKGWKVGNHIVVFVDGEYKCSCEDFIYRGGPCKHILAVILHGRVLC